MVLSRSHRVDYGRVNAEEAARIFFLEAVVEGNMPRPFPFMQHNERVLEALRASEVRLRRWGICPSDDLQVDYLMERAPGVFSLQTLKDFIAKNTDKALRYAEEDWFHASETGMEHFESFKNNPVIAAAYRQKLAKAQEERKAAEHGGVVEFQRILDRQIRSELVFDSSKAWDGLSLEIPADFLPKLSPAIFAHEVSKWRAWMVESFIRELPKGDRKKLEQKKDDFDDRFVECLEKNTAKSPLVSLYEAFESFGNSEGALPVLNPQNEHHLMLHLSVTSTEFSEKFPLELSPEWGECNFFDAVRPVAQKAALSLPVMGIAYGWSPQGSRAMNPVEADFWQRFYRRTRLVSLDDSPLKSLFESRFAFLNRKDESGYALRSLLAMTDAEKEKFSVHYLDQALARFSGIEFARSHKVRSFAEISSRETTAETNSREGLFRLVFDSSYLGVRAFVRAWEIFRETFVGFRRGTKVSEKVLQLSSRLAVEENLYARLRLISAFVLPENADSLGEWTEELSLLPIKSYREKFSPYFAGRFLKDHELKNARETLSLAEKGRADAEAFDSRISLQILLENFELLRYKRSILAQAPEEKVEKNDLLKLRARFKSR
jgi:hypothetical protein